MQIQRRTILAMHFIGLPACLLAFPTTKIKTPKTHTGVQGHSYCWNCPTPLIPTILLDMPGFFEVVFGH